MAHPNLLERRQHVRAQVSAGHKIDSRLARQIAALFGCSPSAVLADVSYSAGKPYAKANPERSIPASENARAKALGLAGVVTRAEWVAIKAQYGDKCLRCGSAEHVGMDHVVPLSRGGQHHKSNIQPLCKRCNSWKHDRIMDFR